MAQFFTDFAAYTTGDVDTVSSAATDWTTQATPGSGWTNEIVDLGGGAHALRVTRASGTTAQNPTRIIYDAVSGTTGDIEVVTKITLGTTSDQNAPVGPALIASDGRAYTWRAIGVATSTTWRLSLIQAANGSASSLGTASISFTEPTAGTPFWMMIGRSGSSLYGSLWLDGAGRPGSPSQTVATETTLTTVQPGIYTFDVSDIPWTFLLFGVGTDGSTAPEAAVSAGSKNLLHGPFGGLLTGKLG